VTAPSAIGSVGATTAAAIGEKSLIALVVLLLL